MARAKTKMINIRTTPEIHQQIKQRAEMCGTTISSFLTTMGVHGQVVMVEHLGETARELNRIGVNLNQLTRLAHEGKISNVNLTETKEEIRHLWQYLNSQTPRAN